MLSGAPRFTCRSGVFLLICVTFLISLSVAAAQQSSGQSSQTAPPAELPAAQPAAAAAASASGAASTPQEKADMKTDTADDSMTAKLGPGDLIEVSVYDVPELATKARVGNSGDLYLPLIDYVHVEGLTLEEAQKLIQKRLEEGGFVRNPHVTIFVDQAASQGVTLSGKWVGPGSIPTVGKAGLLQSTFTPNANSGFSESRCTSPRSAGERSGVGRIPFLFALGLRRNRDSPAS